MKGFLVFLTLALVASTNARVSVEKGIIDDALNMKVCLENAMVSIQASINSVLGTVNEVKSLIAVNVEKIKECQSHGGLIAQATCIIGLADNIKQDITNVIGDVQASLDNLLGAGELIKDCFVNEETARVPEKGIIDDALALKKCLEKAIPAIKGAVENVIATVEDVKVLIASTTEKLDNCKAIGGDKPSIVDQINQATCILGLVDQVKTDVTNIVQEVQASVNNLLAAGDLITSCF